MGFCAAHNDTIISFFYNTEKHIFVDLLTGVERTVTFYVRYAGITGKVILLHVFEKLSEIFIVVCAIFLVDV
ncbi:MAG: hypothetical protein H6Q53_2361, partial [Deltaproteobacteria bacterium]|nr:hypothetical protein [Deltaproteobacteria bacterium]